MPASTSEEMNQSWYSAYKPYVLAIRQLGDLEAGELQLGHHARQHQPGIGEGYRLSSDIVK